MDELFTVSIEFFIFNDELWYRSEGKSPCRLKEQDYEFVTLIANLIEKFYPKAYIALASEYAKSKANLPLFRYRIVSRFCRCNFGNIDNIIDIDASTFHFEHVLCPLRENANLKILYVTLNLRATSRKPRRESWKDGIVESRKKK